MEARTIYICPICGDSTDGDPLVAHYDGNAECVGILVPGTWVPKEAFPALIMPDGMVHRIIMSETASQALKDLTSDPAQPDDDRQTVVKPKDGDDRYWDDQQEKLGR